MNGLWNHVLCNTSPNLHINFFLLRSLRNADLSNENLCRVFICLESVEHKHKRTLRSPFLERGYDHGDSGRKEKMGSGTALSLVFLPGEASAQAAP